jgi:hypothetical protein
MNRQEFEHLRALPGKRITADLSWSSPRDGKPNWIFDEVVVENSADLDVVLNGTYKPNIPAVTFNFVLRGVGPICRIDVNGTIHGNAGRTHKHDLRRETCPRDNLPNASSRSDLDGKTAREIWNELCELAHIEHAGKFQDPEGL